MRAIFPLFSILILVSCQSPQNGPKVTLQDDVYYLASDALEGRESGTKGEKMATAYLAERFAAIGLEQK